VPLVSLWLIFKLNASYLPTEASYNYWLSKATNADDMKYLFNPSEDS